LTDPNLRLCSGRHRDEFIQYLLELREKLRCEKIKIYVRPEIELARYTKNDDETQMKLPGGDPRSFSSEEWKAWYMDRRNKREHDIAQTETVFNNVNPVEKLSEEDFEILKVLGRGAFGKVSLCQKKGTDDLYAIKIMSKADIIERNQIEQIKSEKDILKEMNHPF
jgi:serum/glucocorticoid-regulated kinase 2